MGFLSEIPDIIFNKPAFLWYSWQTRFSQPFPAFPVPVPTAEKTLLTPVLDAESDYMGCHIELSGQTQHSNGCPTPASITRAMMEPL